MTLREIILVLKSYNRREENRAKEMMMRNYNLASMIAEFVSLKLNGKHLPEISKIFPSLASDVNDEEAETEKYKMEWMNFMHNHNQFRKKEVLQ